MVAVVPQRARVAGLNLSPDPESSNSGSERRPAARANGREAQMSPSTPAEPAGGGGLDPAPHPDPERRRLRFPARTGSIAVLVALALSVAMTVLLAAAVYAAYRSEYSARVATLAERAAVINGHVVSDLLAPVRAQDDGQIASIVGGFLSGPTLDAVQIVSAQARPATHAWLKDERGVIRELAQLPALDEHLQHTAVIVPGVSVTIYAPIAPARTGAWQSLRRGLVPLALADLLLIGLMWLLVWYLVLRPVARLERFARRTSLDVPVLERLPAAGFHGELAGLRSSLQDMVNLLRERYQALSRSQERFELAVAGSNDGIWDWDLRTDEVYYSPRLIGLLGFSHPHEFPPVAQSFWLRVHPTDYERFATVLSRHLRFREPNDVQFRVRLADGQYRWFRGRGQAHWDEQGKPLRMCGSLTDIHEQVLAQESLERTQERELRAREEFARQLLMAHEHERTRIANELHDSIGQSLSLIANRARLALNVTELPVSASVHIDSLAEVTAAAIGDVRSLVQNLRPLHIDQIGLTASLEGLIERWSQSADVQVVHRLENVDGQLSGSEATNVYRIAQEALNNILKHAGAHRVEVQLENDLHCVRLMVGDDGCGFDQAATPVRGGGYGLTTMLERAKMLGGTLKIDSVKGRGTRLVVELPVEENLYIDPAEARSPE
jgi:PAS domain S-box-containing protein